MVPGRALLLWIMKSCNYNVSFIPRFMPATVTGKNRSLISEVLYTGNRRFLTIRQKMEPFNFIHLISKANFKLYYKDLMPQENLFQQRTFFTME